MADGPDAPADPFALIATERRALADLVASLTPEQQAAPSLCGRWTTKEVAAHVAFASKPSMVEFATGFLLGRLSFDRANERAASARASWPVERIADTIRANAESRFTPPGFDWHAPLVDALVHREDIAVPLDLPHDRPAESWGHALEFLVSPAARRGFVRKGRPAVRLEASDLDWSDGSGPDVRGPAWALALVLAGRPAGLAALDGPGLAPLTAWVS